MVDEESCLLRPFGFQLDLKYAEDKDQDPNSEVDPYASKEAFAAAASQEVQTHASDFLDRDRVERCPKHEYSGWR